MLRVRTIIENLEVVISGPGKFREFFFHPKGFGKSHEKKLAVI